ncbi:MAG: hypothetical protein ACYSWO_27560 [Planctomycetota bacterium]|jgi:hypothetical protein
MRLTIEERIAALEREIVVLHDKLKMLHKLMKEQRELTLDYTDKMVSASDRKAEIMHPEEIRYTYCCRPRFERLEKQMEEMQKLVAERSPRPAKVTSHELFQ